MAPSKNCCLPTNLERTILEVDKMKGTKLTISDSRRRAILLGRKQIVNIQSDSIQTVFINFHSARSGQQSDRASVPTSSNPGKTTPQTPFLYLYPKRHPIHLNP